MRNLPEKKKVLASLKPGLQDVLAHEIGLDPWFLLFRSSAEELAGS